MLTQAIHDLVFKRDSTQITNLLNVTDSVRKGKATQILCALMPLRLTPEGNLKWIKDKSQLKAMHLPDTTLLNNDQKDGLCKRLEQSLKHLGIPSTSSDNLALRLRRLRAEIAFTVSDGNEAKLADNFLKFCRENSEFLRPQKPLGRKNKLASEKSEFWLDSSERTVSVRAITGGIPDSNRRKH